MIVTINAKCSDMCQVIVRDDEGNTLVDRDGYVPNNIGVGCGDYVEFDIDNETGQIVNWKPLTKTKIKQLNS